MHLRNGEIKKTKISKTMSDLKNAVHLVDVYNISIPKPKDIYSFQIYQIFVKTFYVLDHRFKK